jgi:ribosomal protein S18 acetylase RimI-like enzyme
MDEVTIIRSFREKDRNAVVAIWNLVFADDPPWSEPNAVIDTKQTVQPDLFLIAELEGKVLGTALAGFDGVRGWVHHVAVHPDHQRRGVAASLIAAAEAGLKEMGCQKLNLQVRATNTAVLAFYEDLGFQAEDRISFGKVL